MLSTLKIEIPFSPILNEQSMIHQEETRVKDKNRYVEFCRQTRLSSEKSESSDESSIAVFREALASMAYPINRLQAVQEKLKKLVGKRHCCEFSRNRKKVIEKYSENNLDIIFMDIQMPVRDGFEGDLRFGGSRFHKTMN